MKYQNQKVQKNLWHREEEPHNNHENQLFQDFCKTRMDTMQRTAKRRTTPQWK